MFQTLGITFEDMVITAAWRAGVEETAWMDVIGYMWVICRFIVTATRLVTLIVAVWIEHGGGLIPSTYFFPSFCGIPVLGI
jgi:hypothetical protein